ncbi:MAG: hypothetical protein ACO3JL_02585 [Myxococcota bacterium]
MKRVLLLASIAFVLQAFIAAAAVAFGVAAVPLTPAVLVVAYAALVEPPVEGALSATCVGFLLDAISGTAIGLNMLACLLLLLVGRLMARRVPSPVGPLGALFVSALAAGYYLFVLTLLYIFERGRESLALEGLLSTSILTGAASLLVFPLIQRIFVRLGLEERAASVAERLSRRARGA